MKKYLIILLLLLLDIFLYTNKAILSFSQVDLKLKENELALTIFSLNNSKSILINKSNLLILEYIDSLDLERYLSLYGVNILDNIFIDNQYTSNLKSYNKKILNGKIEFDNVKIITNKNIQIINYYDYSFCIYKNGENKNLDNCNFIYFLDIDEIDFTDNVLVVFFDSNISQKKIEKYYDKWVDSYILNDKTFYTLKLFPDDYDVFEVNIN